MALQMYIGVATLIKRFNEDKIMHFVNSYFAVAMYFVVIVGIVIGVLRWHKSVASECRLIRMMVCCGIDEVIASNADQFLKLDMNTVRSRCRNCPVTDLCDRWLNGEAVASNNFCPNVWHFTTAAGSSQS